MTPRYLNTKQAAAYLGISRTAFERDVAPKLPRYKPTPRRVLFAVDDLDAFMRSRVLEPPRPANDNAFPIREGDDEPPPSSRPPTSRRSRAFHDGTLSADPTPPQAAAEETPLPPTVRRCRRSTVSQAVASNPAAQELLRKLQGGRHGK